MSDDKKIFELYVESAAAEEQPKLQVSQLGTKRWLLHGKRHRTDGPAVEYADGSKEWYKHGKIHREDGPAWEDPNTGAKEWWLNHYLYDSAEQWAEALLKLRNQPHDAKSVDAFLKTIMKKDAEEAI